MLAGGILAGWLLGSAATRSGRAGRDVIGARTTWRNAVTYQESRTLEDRADVRSDWDYRASGPVDGGQRSARYLAGGFDRPQQNRGDVDDLDTFGLTAGLLLGHAVIEHGQAERAGGRDRLGAGPDGLLDPLDVDPLADPLLHPHASAAGAAAE